MFLRSLFENCQSPYMNNNFFQPKRRSTRNRTVLIDPSFIPNSQQEEKAIMELQQQSVCELSMRFTNIATSPIDGKSCYNPIESNNERTYSFNDLMSAFKSIEKRNADNQDSVNNILKKFKSNDEKIQENNYCEIKSSIETQIFPKILSNPFLKNDQAFKSRETTQFDESQLRKAPSRGSRRTRQVTFRMDPQ